jgi:hypothetical protein
MRPLFLVALSALTLAGCPTDPAPVDAPGASEDAPATLPDGGGEPVPSPDGAGFCCPIDMPSCDCFHNGGFATSVSGCEFLRVCDAAPPSMIVTDEHGCARLVATGSCLARDVGGGTDAGVP